MSGTKSKQQSEFKDIRWSHHTIEYLMVNHWDALDLSAALQKKFPGMRFFDPDIGRAWVDEEASMELRNRLFDEGVYEPMWVARGHPGDSPIPYVSSLSSREHLEVAGWIEPPGWKAKWYLSLNGAYFVEDPPKLEFELARGSDAEFFDEYTDWGTGVGVKCPPPDDHVATLMGHRLTCRVVRGDKEMERFKRQLWRVVHKLTVDEFIWVDRKTIEPKLFVARPVETRAGFHACTWACKRRFNLLYHDLKPLDYFGSGGCDLPSDIRQQIREYREEQREAVERRNRLARERRSKARLAKQSAAQKKPAPDGGGQAKG